MVSPDVYCLPLNININIHIDSAIAVYFIDLSGEGPVHRSSLDFPFSNAAGVFFRNTASMERS
jgi:hypothetical protein